MYAHILMVTVNYFLLSILDYADVLSVVGTCIRSHTSLI